MKPELHPACAEWPKMSENELKELADDIKQKGLVEAVTLMPDGRLLDGSNRWDGCELAGIEPRTVVYEGDDPIGFVVSQNKNRRHLDKGQLAIVMARLMNLKPGSNQYQHKTPGAIPFAERNHKSKDLAKLAAISCSSIRHARLVLNHGTPNIIAMVEKGDVRVRTAAEAVRHAPKEVQANWTKEDLRREGRKVMNSYTSAQKRKSVFKHPPSPGMIKFPSVEETGFPINGTIEEKDAHSKKYGRTPMYPKEVKDMLNNEQWVSGYMSAIVSVTNASHPDVEAFFGAIDAMLAWVPRPDQGDSWAINFAAKAKKELRLLEVRLPLAVERITKLHDAWKQRGQGALIKIV
jgi:hypothetical protein